ncbi:MAG: hypothetical protein JKY10_00045 [Cohaesibacteraceae bacterium]|nr:hypothetical protein [Cohaesibacteraceae bacterium]
MSKLKIAEKLRDTIEDMGENILNDQLVAADLNLVKKTHAALDALIDLHNDLDSDQKYSNDW